MNDNGGAAKAQAAIRRMYVLMMSMAGLLAIIVGHMDDLKAGDWQLFLAVFATAAALVLVTAAIDRVSDAMRRAAKEGRNYQ